MKRFTILFLSIVVTLMAVNVTSAKGTKSSAKVYFHLWGSIGESKAEIDMNGSTGYYYLNDNEDAKHKLVLKSYNRKTGRCVLNAYYHEEFAGTLYGEYRTWDTGDHHSEIYTGTFESASGATLSFDFYCD